ncbi:hypothetical protein PENVUL_c145G09383 [Penicillium vulpinum]|uniref:Reverse transcriptase Ty1/copia-type domain-containing protein n=1 Tax=Penicillium vulpinum TaxID=29845 RepID=A0A1V6QYN9_9EURO|nr:hypothetical protein PENVUL_c145G09383 [Penicillium vulpinum]
MSFKIFVAIAAAEGWFLHYIDIMTAFLYAELKEPIEIELPEGQREEHPDQIGLLMKTIYGLKQSPREWTNSLYVIVYIDDLLVLSSSEEEIQVFKDTVSKHFDTTDKGVLERYLAINVFYKDNSIYLSQSDYIDKILTRFGLENCKPVHTPIDKKQALIPFDGTTTKLQIKEFQTKIGTLIWLMVSTRPDISFVVIKLARHTTNPSEAHFQALKRVFRYLTGSKYLAISFSRDTSQSLSGYCDAD